MPTNHEKSNWEVWQFEDPQTGVEVKVLAPSLLMAVHGLTRMTVGCANQLVENATQPEQKATDVPRIIPYTGPIPKGRS